MKTDLLLQVKQHILEEPARLDMAIYKYQLKPGSRYVPPFGEPSCGTVGCIAGWALMLANKTVVENNDHDNCDTAMALLGLGSNEAARLFLPEKWPRVLWQGYRAARKQKDGATAARVVGERIDLFIESNGLI